MDPIAAFLQSSGLGTSPFPATSRYHTIALAVHTRPDGVPVAYLRRRFVPAAEEFALLHEHVVQAGDRVDNLAARHVGDPLQYWRLCDGNRALRPDDLTATIGRRLRITLPHGVPGVTDAG